MTEFRPGPKSNEARNKLIMALRESGKTFGQIGLMLGVSKQAISGVVGRERARRKDGPAKIGRPSKLSAEMEADFVALYVKRWTIRQIAAKYGLSLPTVSHSLERSGAHALARQSSNRELRTMLVNFKAPVGDRVWCSQCERNVLTAEATTCARAFCKADPDKSGPAIAIWRDREEELDLAKRIAAEINQSWELKR